MRRGRRADVEVANARTGAARFVPCDTVVFTGDWIPDRELARLAGLAMDPGTGGPAVNTTLATSAAGLFAAGNLVHAAETADITALSGRHAARHIAAFLADGRPVARRHRLKPKRGLCAILSAKDRRHIGVSWGDE